MLRTPFKTCSYNIPGLSHIDWTTGSIVLVENTHVLCLCKKGDNVCLARIMVGREIIDYVHPGKRAWKLTQYCYYCPFFNYCLGWL